MEAEIGGGRRRVRLRFEDRSILSGAQRSEGLRRCWLLLHPEELETVSDLASYLLDKFSLHHSCPYGILLSVDGYVLPPFESTCILMDKDLIRVKKKGDSALKLIKTDKRENHGIDLFKDEEEKAVVPSTNLLAIEDVVETIEDQSCDREEVEELSSGDLTSKKKRKRSVQLKRGEKRKKSSSTDRIKDLSVADDISEEGQHITQGEGYHQNERLSQKGFEKNQCRKTKRSKVTDGPDADLRRDQLQENNSPTANASDAPVLDKKLPSRSARRKKAKRLWLREQAKIQMENSKAHMQEINQDCVSERKDREEFYEQQKTNNMDMDMENEVIPVVVRPGHIRFEPLDDSDMEKQMQVETIQWNGTISKKRGQKWGMEKSSVRESTVDEYSNDDNAKKFSDYDQEPCHATETIQWNGMISKKRGQKWGMERSSVRESNVDEDSNDDNAKNFSDYDQEPCHATVNFDKLAHLSSSPKVGDIVAYRLVELSSSWCPEISPFRVGKVSLYDAVSKQVKLIPVAEYPIVSGDKVNGVAVDPTSLYMEDGSLEIDFPSLVDVRTFNYGEAVIESAGRNDGPYANNAGEPSPRTTTNGKGGQNNDPWEEELNKVLNAKKAQLLQEDGSSKNSSNQSWSYKAMRGSALGPTIALLRARNDL